MRRVHSSTIAHVSASPPLIPDGRISRVRLAAMAFPWNPSRPNRNLSARSHTPLVWMVWLSARHPVRLALLPGPTCPDSVSFMMPAIYREPLCLLKALPLAAWSPWSTSESITSPSSLLPAHAPNQNPPNASGLTLNIRSLQVATSPCWELAFPDVISADPSVDAWLPTPVESSWCIYPFLPTKHRPSPR